MISWISIYDFRIQGSFYSRSLILIILGWNQCLEWSQLKDLVFFLNILTWGGGIFKWIIRSVHENL